jgi:hypothetical protein
VRQHPVLLRVSQKGFILASGSGLARMFSRVRDSLCD